MLFTASTALTWSTFTGYTEFTNNRNFVFLQVGAKTYSWYVSANWDPEATNGKIICMIVILYWCFLTFGLFAAICIALIFTFYAMRKSHLRIKNKKAGDSLSLETSNAGSGGNRVAI
ncbi:hypothetical protein HELRODRAFT_177330 [Helobdella robusta]|uniref:Uncharacterized protein n=1 Tax=Helobdella robusta TaxID=6412 RepID=T1FBI3_HELRO|nr:hypothetical protein HELRODRAFT_177330 [Helobdella robusta]ESN98093.1 hypothetical protein HELRODRAFT_177330 [Helobdella robusta]